MFEDERSLLADFGVTKGREDNGVPPRSSNNHFLYIEFIM
jgi:hypothetical protein